MKTIKEADVNQLRAMSAHLLLKLDRTENPGRCYHVAFWTVYSLVCPSEALLRALLPGGQEFSVENRHTEGGFHVCTIRTATDSSD